MFCTAYTGSKDMTHLLNLSLNIPRQHTLHVIAASVWHPVLCTLCNASFHSILATFAWAALSHAVRFSLHLKVRILCSSAININAVCSLTQDGMLHADQFLSWQLYGPSFLPGYQITASLGPTFMGITSTKPESCAIFSQLSTRYITIAGTKSMSILTKKAVSAIVVWSC